MSKDENKPAAPEDATPESLMRVFQGAGWGKMIAFTVVLHVVVIGGSSVPYLLRSFGGALSGERSREERIEKAVADATASLQKIAEAGGIIEAVGEKKE